MPEPGLDDGIRERQSFVVQRHTLTRYGRADGLIQPRRVEGWKAGHAITPRAESRRP